MSTVQESQSIGGPDPDVILSVQDRATSVQGPKVSAPSEPLGRCVTCPRAVRLGHDCAYCQRSILFGLIGDSSDDDVTAAWRARRAA